jgi:hypothetical protein
MNRRCDPNKTDACEDWNKANPILSLVVAADGQHIFAGMDGGIISKCVRANSACRCVQAWLACSVTYVVVFRV